MKTVNIIRNWDFPNILQQTPNSSGLWGNVKFYLENKTVETDYALVVNVCNWKEIKAKHVWTIMMEPPVFGMENWHQGHPRSEKVLTHYVKVIDGKKYIGSQGCLPWHVFGSYNELKTWNIPNKENKISWITSNANSMPGHQARMKFLKDIIKNIPFDLYGKGFSPILDKATGLKQYKYSIAIENHPSKYHFTEKLIDCFLTFTLPFYFGCQNLDDYFPKESYIWIDIKDPRKAVSVMKEAVSSNQWHERLEFICEARRRVLEEWQLFPYIARMINGSI